MAVDKLFVKDVFERSEFKKEDNKKFKNKSNKFNKSSCEDDLRKIFKNTSSKIHPYEKRFKEYQKAHNEGRIVYNKKHLFIQILFFILVLVSFFLKEYIL